MTRGGGRGGGVGIPLKSDDVIYEQPLTLCNIATTNGAIWGKYTPNGEITNDSPGAISPLSTKGGMHISSPHKEGKEQTGIINFNQSRWHFHRVCTDFLQWPFLFVNRKHSPWFPDLWWLSGLGGRTSGTSRPTCLFGWRNIKDKETSLGDTRWDIFWRWDTHASRGKAYVLSMSLNMVWKLKSRLTYFKSLIEEKKTY